ncbi:MAG: glycosyltransferase family 4 protein [Patescibacteria group bacterium]
MTVSLVTFANLGKKENLKTPDILPVIEALLREKELAQALCQLSSGFGSSHVTSAIAWPVWYAVRLFEKTTGRSFARDTMEGLFDFFASLKLRKSEVTILHGAYFLPRTTKRARAFGSLIIDIPVSAHIATNATLEAEELKRLGLPDHDGWYMKLARTSTHADDVDYVIALSEFVRDSYIQAGFPEDRMYVASPDIAPGRFAPGEGATDGKFRVVYAAFTAQLKGLHYLLDAWQSLALPDAELVIVGGYGLMPEELRRRYDSGITADPSIVWAGATSMPETWYQRSSVLVFPSLTEGFGRVTLEAMACGIPVITTENARGIVEDGKTGFVVPIRDAAALREKIEYLYTHKDVASRMGEEARRAAEAKKPFGEAVYAIYRDILKREGNV